MPRKMIWTYRGVTIFRNTDPRYRLRYSARALGRMLAANTLKGMRDLIRAEYGS